MSKEVFVVIEQKDMDSYINKHGKTAPIHNELCGVFSTMDKAEQVAEQLQADNDKAVTMFGCDDCTYVILPYDLDKLYNIVDVE